MTIIDEVREIKERDKQTEAVRAHLLKHGSISNHMAIYDGVPGYGVITRLGARIWDLRHDPKNPMEIRTDKAGRDTVYTLVTAPMRQLTLV